MTTTVQPCSLTNIRVWVKPSADAGQYDVITEPAEVVICSPDTIINYQIVDTSGYPIVFTGMSVEPHDNGQLSKSTVSLDGKLLTFSDINTSQITMNVNLKFKNSDEGQEFSHDPQIRNDPR